MKKQSLLTIEATITERGQTTVPAPIRRMLGVEKGSVVFKGLADGTVIIERKDESTHDDPALGPFLDLLAGDIANNPHRLIPVSAEMLKSLDLLTAGVHVDLDRPLEDD